MIIYVNGDSHSAGHDAGGPEFSYGRHISDALAAEFICDAEAGCSNDRIIRTTRQYHETNKPDIVIIGWSTWERAEWEHNGRIYTVSGGGHSQLPQALQQRYKEWVVHIDSPSTQHDIEFNTHDKIWDFHKELEQQGIPHLFFNCYSHFFYIESHVMPRHDWGQTYIDPYSKNSTYYFWLENRKYKPSNPEWYHYGPDAHIAWADFLLPAVNNILTQIK